MPPTTPDPQTRETERHEATTEAKADRAPTADEQRLADEHELDTSVAAHEKEMNERGAKQRGEGRLP